jgi:hypothetical protein
VADSHKRTCKNKELNSENKTVNRFPKIKEAFTVKRKMISADHYFRPPPNTEKMLKIFFRKNFTLKQTEHKSLC